MEWLLNPEIWISLITLTVLEIVLGIDNIVFISIMSSKLPVNQQKKAIRPWAWDDHKGFVALVINVGDDSNRSNN